jgi:hypothetical protein
MPEVGAGFEGVAGDDHKRRGPRFDVIPTDEENDA